MTHTTATTTTAAHRAHSMGRAVVKAPGAHRAHSAGTAAKNAKPIAFPLAKPVAKPPIQKTFAGRRGKPAQ